MLLLHSYVFNFLQQHMLFYALMAMCNQLQMFPTHESHSTVQITHGGGLKNILVPPHMEQPYS